MQWIKTHAIVVEERPQHFSEHLDIRDREDKDVPLLDSWLIRGCCSSFEASINEYSLLKSSKEWKAHWCNLFTKQGSSGLISSGVLGMNTSRNRRTNMITRRRTPSLELESELNLPSSSSSRLYWVGWWSTGIWVRRTHCRSWRQCPG